MLVLLVGTGYLILVPSQFLAVFSFFSPVGPVVEDSGFVYLYSSLYQISIKRHMYDVRGYGVKKGYRWTKKILFCYIPALFCFFPTKKRDHNFRGWKLG